MPNVFIAGATGYLGRHLCAEYKRRGFHVTALVRNAKTAGNLDADRLVAAQATRPETLTGLMTGMDLVVSALGITRQKDGLNYRDVDYRANLNLLREAERAGVARFAYVHVLNADKMRDVPGVAAKIAFVDALQASPIASTVIAPSGFFSDMSDFLTMAKGGRVWLFGTGDHKINPIHGADLASATADATTAGTAWLDVGGPEVFTHEALAHLAFDALHRPARITHLPDVLRLLAVRVVPALTPKHIGEPVRFFLTAMGMDMVGAFHGTHKLADHFAAQARVK
ncbi:uncharacterized protein YbjT (DUF2867 family) [Rhodobacter aestuarii]|uniref:Uncharacterized conserved protein YbjT, contains NAD(P)-binding and DUF2867 domains n=1 Tax=Rhodobacter aestuarii TaxID=453582 RepID=A0A1N7MUF9_9RHOB|nr:NAD(P)H-binding protein [Rhodobacter aestuarii]PTV96531.1 uncharacterized protein YbjT (DUF2867 family) [Rhodobacter aestuarii]SIS89591.1 Uncharacterized conserved protein YbjT, contains NAD(P)-binding and DUF2867 domains [Rhodobacter aestuarii]